jgi:hypothetical protein
MSETWSLTLREEHRLRVFENKVLRRIFGPKRNEVRGGWRKLQNEELHDLNFSPNKIKVIKSRKVRWAGHIALVEENKNVYRILVGKTERKRPLGSPRRRWEYNMKADLRGMGLDGMDWIDLAQDRDQWRVRMNAVMNLRVPYDIGKFLSG